jgi:hypothetical protein
MPGSSRASSSPPPRLAAATAALALALPTPAAAQAPRDSAATDAFCWRGHPLPRCREFALFELGYHATVATTTLHDTVAPPPGIGGSTYVLGHKNVQSQFLWTVGLMRNRAGARPPGSAIGGGLVAGVTEQGWMFGLHGRYRRWLDTRTSAELGASVVRMRTPEPVPRAPSEFVGDPSRFGLMLDGHFNASDRISLGTRLVVIPDSRHARVGVLAGGRLGSSFAVVGTAATAVFVMLLAAAISGGDY